MLDDTSSQYNLRSLQAEEDEDDKTNINDNGSGASEDSLNREEL